jgi:hypothetical protein
MQSEWNVDEGKATQTEQIITLTSAIDALSATQDAGKTPKEMTIDQTAQDAERKKWAWKDLATSGGQPKSKKIDSNHSHTKWVHKGRP